MFFLSSQPEDFIILVSYSTIYKSNTACVELLGGTDKISVLSLILLLSSNIEVRTSWFLTIPLEDSSAMMCNA